MEGEEELKVLFLTIILTILFNFLKIPIGVVMLVFGIIKGLRCQEHIKTFNADMKIIKFYKNDIFEATSLLIVFYFMYDGFQASSFQERFEIPLTVFIFFIAFFFLFRGLEDKLFDKS
ncbi:hypothetical protein HYG86_01370 [Alkalicella caledoniensis]|uniref:Uncharacterized protein n=1 Tax=Alkalicella caledoniensis TaxID=2731377 RepID=A0A7G9W498_ALKCA|nr:hypothetical protein [Alkalicella caledoniensis]QNO13510.1 hypothetical protein HYG86_01370 [Alkalicella caledoniensis]